MRALFVVSTFIFLGPAIVFAQIPFQAMTEGAGPIEIGLILTVDVATTMLLAPLAGRLADRWSPRIVIVLGFALGPPAFAFLAEAHGTTLIIVSRMLMGASLAVRSVLQSLVVSFDSNSRLAGLSGINGAYALAYVVGSILSSLTFALWPEAFELASWMAAFVSAGGLLAAWLFVRSSPNHEMRPIVQIDRAVVDTSKFDRSRTLVLIGQGFLAFGFSAFAATFGMWCASTLRWGTGHLALIFLIAASASAVLQFGPVSLLSRQFGDIGTASLSCWTVSIGLLLLIFIPSWATAIIAAAAVGCGSGLGLSSFQSLSSRLWRGDRQSSLFGASLSINSAARIIAPLIAAFSFSHWAEWAPFGLGLGAMTLTLMILKATQDIPVIDQLTSCQPAS